jgi:leader peptidase (prepilin peptidase)/N-methyltransferase
VDLNVPLLYAAWKIAAFAAGASLGSFMGVALSRIPDGVSLWSPPSRCDVCGTPIAWRDNIPLISWLALGARCRACEAPLPALYPLIELLGGMVAWLVFDRFVPSPAFLDAPHLAAAAVFYLFCWLLLLATYLDLKARIIPEISSVWAVPIGVACAAGLEWLGYAGWLSIGWRASVIGALLGGGVLGTLSLVWRYALGRDGLGWGDVRLVAMIGAFLGPLPGLWTVLLLGSFGGALVGIGAVLALRRSVYLPFGPSLAAAGITYVLWGDQLVVRLFPGMAAFL